MTTRLNVLFVRKGNIFFCLFRILMLWGGDGSDLPTRSVFDDL